MRIQISKPIFRVGMTELLLSPITWLELTFLHGYMVFLLPAHADAMFWKNYFLFWGSSLLLQLNGFSALFIFRRAKPYKCLPLLLASPISLESFIGTNILVCFLFNAGNLVVHVCLVSLLRDAPAIDYSCLPALMIVLCCDLAALARMGCILLCRKNPVLIQMEMAFFSFGLLILGISCDLALPLPTVYLWIAACCVIALIPMLLINIIARSCSMGRVLSA